MQRPTFTEWKRELRASLEAAGIPPQSERFWQQYYKQGYIAEHMFEVEKQIYDICRSGQQTDGGNSGAP